MIQTGVNAISAGSSWLRTGWLRWAEHWKRRFAWRASSSGGPARLNPARNQSRIPFSCALFDGARPLGAVDFRGSPGKVITESGLR